jgi:MFS family permease
MVSLRLKYLLFANYLNLFGFFLFSPLYALFATGIGAKPQLVGLSYAVNTLAAACMIFLFGRVEDRTPDKRRYVVLGYFWLSAAAFSFLLVHDITTLILVQIFNAIGSGLLTPAWKAVYSKVEDRGREASEWSFYDGGNLLASSAGAALSGIILAYFGFHAIFVLMGAVQLIAALVSLKLLNSKHTQN